MTEAGKLSVKGSLSNKYILSAGICLVITGLAKIWSAFGSAGFLKVGDPILGVTYKTLMLSVGATELVIGLVCCFKPRRMLALGLVAWISTNFFVYRLSLWWIGWHRPCNCLGNLTDALHIRPEVADNIMKVVLGYLLLGSYGTLFWEWRQRRRAALLLTAKSKTVASTA